MNWLAPQYSKGPSESLGGHGELSRLAGQRAMWIQDDWDPITTEGIRVGIGDRNKADTQNKNKTCVFVLHRLPFLSFDRGQDHPRPWESWSLMQAKRQMDSSRVGGRQGAKRFITQNGKLEVSGCTLKCSLVLWLVGTMSILSVSLNMASGWVGGFYPQAPDISLRSPLLVSTAAVALLRPSGSHLESWNNYFYSNDHA